MVKNLKLLDKALQLLPEVKETVVEPLDIAAFLKPLKKGDSVEIDFGRHLVGHIKLKLGYVRSHPDAPVWLRFSFAENKKGIRGTGGRLSGLDLFGMGAAGTGAY